MAKIATKLMFLLIAGILWRCVCGNLNICVLPRPFQEDLVDGKK